MSLLMVGIVSLMMAGELFSLKIKKLGVSRVSLPMVEELALLARWELNILIILKVKKLGLLIARRPNLLVTVMMN